MSRLNILIIEDDPHISKLVKYNLEREHYDCTVVSNGEKAIEILKNRAANLVILDIMLPGMDGFEFCRIIKQHSSLKSVPIIMLTAKGQEVDRVVGLELGADDYIVKPFSIRELVLRIKAVLKRKEEKKPEETINIGDITIDIPKHKITVKNKDVPFTAMEFKLLLLLIERAGRVQSREDLLSDVWGIESEIFTRTVDTHIKRIRQKLGKQKDMIETVRGVGYRFKEME
ncbi:DNA-binding response regulator [bacterium Unc6]|nr:DNA-binding response regulator [bacterium Unc6]